ncbi:MAG: 30S ribosomal protein S17 [Sutterella sp.]|jgi:small subunit ribosomal protein S17|uniref:Small ribosomal subunit protein uS17 n=1 Tax=Mesosutterella multiformis TaxID=2259133 RepID=A0A388SA71_9BURK|nr:MULTISPECIES: 30S ribosomal protein S17 [Sutterellaceae]MBS5812805.1 30S ribosomal protein S17 [Sutterella sp.]MCH3935662.1 30S ribosomal protein S17 [Mesosutterella sp.]RGU76917.1 30S ribosomal protein S17 [Sutterella sp. AF15-45LB]RGU78013.1 30S ribosomal protein S17 [Sutterella sp. AF15-44LB]RHH06385.1 30S ribosomal protein S17 [Sutterella sp. AM18-8-1]
MTEEKVEKTLGHTLTGVVVSDKMDKTITVLVERRVKHPLYGKYVTKTNKVHVHDEANSAAEGDTVEIAATRPISKTVHWNLVRIVHKAVKI